MRDAVGILALQGGEDVNAQFFLDAMAISFAAILAKTPPATPAGTRSQTRKKTIAQCASVAPKETRRQAVCLSPCHSRSLKPNSKKAAPAS